MGYREQPDMPARVNAALRVLYHCKEITDPCEASAPRRDLNALEQSVQTLALRVLRDYLAGEMDFGDAPPRRGGDTEDGDAPVPAPSDV